MKIFYQIFLSLCKLLSFIYPKRFFEMCGVVKTYVYGFKVASKVAQHGERIKIQQPIYLKGGQYMQLGDNFSALSGLILQCWDSYGDFKYAPELIIGENVNLGRNNHIGCINKIIIGDNLLTGNNVYITDHFHGSISKADLQLSPISRPLYSKGTVVVGNNVWIGDNVTILPGIVIGNNVIIGANAVVTKSIEDNTVVAGVPAKKIKDLCS